MDNIQNLITDNLHIWSTALDEKKSGRGRGGANKDKIYGIKKLRELIYNLSAIGKLVETSSNPRPMKLCEIASFIMGQAPPGDMCNKNGDGTIFVKTGEFGIKYPVEQEWTTKPLKLAKKGDVLICVVGATIGKLNLGIDCAIGRSVAAIRPSDKIITDYLYYSLMPFTISLRTNSKGSAQGVIGKDELGNVLIRVPPLAEQHRIVAKVDELMKLCDDLEAGIIKSYDVHSQLVETLLNNLCSSQNNDDFNSTWQIIYNNFETLFTTEESIEKLKQSILQLAIMGKLVPQDPNDEPASELLKRIATEKQKLITEGKLKKEKPLPPITDAEKPFDLPKGWEWVKLGAICEIITSGSRDWAQYFTPDGSIFLTMGNLSRGSFQLRLETLRYVKPPESQEGSRTRVKGGDILLSITGDVGNLALIPEGFPESYINQHISMVRPMPIFKSNYIPWAMLSPLLKIQYDEPQRGVKNSFRLSDVSLLFLPLPPINEQHRIVAKVVELMELCDDLKSKITLANQTKITLANTLSQNIGVSQ